MFSSVFNVTIPLLFTRVLGNNKKLLKTFASPFKNTDKKEKKKKTKYRVVTYNDELPPIAWHDPLIIRTFKVAWQMKYSISAFTEDQ